MNNFNLIAMQIKFANPWWLLLLIPLIALSLLPYLRLPKAHRRTRNRVVSLALHLVIVVIGVSLLSGLTFHREEVLTTFDTVIVIDASDSNDGVKNRIDDYVENVLNEEDASNFNIGIVTFGRDQICVSNVNSDPLKVRNEYVDNIEKADGSATDIAAALNYAKGLLKEKRNARLVLLSDGLETDGDASSAVKSIAQDGISVFAVYFNPAAIQSETQIERIEVGKNASVGGVTDVSVYLRSTGKDNVRLTLYDNGNEWAKKTLTVNGGLEKLGFSYSFATSGLHEICAKIEVGNDTFTENNIAYSYAYIASSDKVLIVDGTGDQASKMEYLISSADYEVTVVAPNDVPEDVYALNAYSRVILMNVNLADIPYPDYDAVLESYVYDYGGGLFTTGGTNTYALGNMTDTAFESMLPVTLTTEDEPVLEIMIVLDLSNSMGKYMSTSAPDYQTRLSYAKEGIKACLDTLRDTDYVGVSWFNKTSNVIVPISPATSRDDIMKVIDNLQAPTGASGTQYNLGLTSAQTELFNSKNNADKQHVIFLTDGKPQDTNYGATLESMSSRGITVSTVAIYDPKGAGQTINGIPIDDMNDIGVLENAVKDMAQKGGGNCYFVEYGNQLPDIMRKETELSKRDLVNVKGGRPEIKDYSSVIANVERLKKVNGYVTSKAKLDATVPFTIGDAPLYAEWNYGLGYVGSFMSDFGSSWASGYLLNSAKNERTFILNVIQRMSPKDDEMDIEFGEGNFSPMLTVKRDVVNGYTMKATVTDPDGNDYTYRMTSESDGYSCRISTPKEGVYSVIVEEFDDKANRVAKQTVYYAFSYSYEYDAFRDFGDGYVILSELVNKGNGGLLDANKPLFTSETLTVTEDYDPLIPLIIVMLVAFLVDIAVRKFKFKWPHEIIKAYKEKKNVEKTE